MRVLVIGDGGREHALVWALDRAASVQHVVAAPGNAGIAEVAETRAVAPTDPAAVVELARATKADLVVVGPEAPLVAGVADALDAAGVAVFGPSRAAAAIEGSKTFAKDVMSAAGVETAGYWAGDDPEAARGGLDLFDPPYVVKADGLAAGKGVRICATRAEAEEAIDAALVDRVFGDAGATVVIEQYLHGPEASLFGLCDGTHVVPLVPAQDYKRALDGDQGLNTGGMGAYSPVPALTGDAVDWLYREVLQPVVDELARRGRRFVGVLYAGLVLTDFGPVVLEFNARFGDPETQAVLPRLQTDLGTLLAACAQGRLADHPSLQWDERAAVTVVLASGGYPGAYQTGLRIRGLDVVAQMDDAMVFHAGTRRAEDGTVQTAGGRVLAVTGLGADIPAARATAYRAADMIAFDGMYRRADIAAAPTTGIG